MSDAVASERIAVVGAGAWGTALASAIARNGRPVLLWGRDPAAVDAINRDRRNPRYLDGIELPEGIRATREAADVDEADALLFATPSHTFRAMLRQHKGRLRAGVPFLWACKGLEPETHLLMHEVVADEFETPPAHGVVSGPSFAREVAAGLPTALTIASTDAKFAARTVDWFHGDTIRAYTSPDVTGVEVGGALKNVLAIACGISDGLGFGANARAAVITRGLAELMRLGRAMGGREETFMGLAGLGDLVLTCTDDQSRNRRFGLAIARGLDAEQAQREIGQAVEGVRTTEAAARLARQHGIEAPIIDQVQAVLHEGCPPRTAVETLLARDPKQELPHAR